MCKERRYAREDMYVGGREAFAAADALISARHRYFRGFTPLFLWDGMVVLGYAIVETV